MIECMLGSIGNREVFQNTELIDQAQQHLEEMAVEDETWFMDPVLHDVLSKTNIKQRRGKKNIRKSKHEEGGLRVEEREQVEEARVRDTESGGQIQYRGNGTTGSREF
jgi:glycerol dehydrogenase-like iron-containing ADH family enzyme